MADVYKDVEALPDSSPPAKAVRGPRPTNKVAEFGEKIFQVHTRGSSWLAEFRAGCVLFMVSAYILFLNPLILSGGSSGFNTGMPSGDIALATSICTGVATMIMGCVSNYPWVVSVQLGTNSFFVNSVLKINEPCGYHATMRGPDRTCFDVPCTCVPMSATNMTLVPDVVVSGQCAAGTPNTCQGTKIPYEQALAATFVEGLIFIFICVSGLRSVFLKMLPKTILMAGAAGIGVFIAYVGAINCNFIVGAAFPNLLGLAEDIPYVASGWGEAGYTSGVGWNSCVMYFAGPPFGPVCNWLAVAGLLFTGIMMLWNINGAFIIGIFFTMFISWIIFPEKISNGGLVPDKVAAAPVFKATAGSLDFNWGDNTSTLVGAFVTFLYLDFIGSCITFVSLGQMAGILNDKGDMPRSNIAFLADGIGSMLGGLLGTSALTTYVESASAMREGGRTGFTAVVCALWFFLSMFLWPLFSQIPSIATGPILCLIGVVIFMQAIMDIDWEDMSDAIPAFTTILGMPFTHNIAYGVIGGIIVYVFLKFFCYKLFPGYPLYQQKWPGYKLWKKWDDDKSPLFTPIPGWNADADGNKLAKVSEVEQDFSLMTYAKKKFAAKKAGAKKDDAPAMDTSIADDTAHGPSS